MQIRVVTDQPWEIPTDLLVIPFVGPPAFTGVLDALDTRTGGELRALEAFGEIRRRRYLNALAAPGDTRARRILMVSAGRRDQIRLEVARRVGATAVRRLLNRHATSVAVWLAPLVEALDASEAEVADHVTRGLVEGGFEPKMIYDIADNDSVPADVEELILIASAADVPAVQRAAERGGIIGEGSNMARRLANRAANDVTPQVLADEAREIAATHGLWIDVLDEARAAELGMGLFLAVGRGSANPPRMIVMRAGERGQKDRLGRHLALVGKGVCFDSGGISIKPADRMEEMKMDKTGACTVIAAIATAARLAPGLPLLVVAPAVENMPGGRAAKPGDIVRAMNGKVVDITNTDAEGRLILADAMTYAERLGATHIVDVATLTGAVGRALGSMVTGAFATPDAWWNEVSAAADRAGERYWRMPLVQDYEHDMDSWYADLQNSGSSDGSLVKSGLFLERFRTVPWAHLDIGGSAYFRYKHSYAPAGATGVTLGTLVELVLAGARG